MTSPVPHAFGDALRELARKLKADEDFTDPELTEYLEILRATAEKLDQEGELAS